MARGAGALSETELVALLLGGGTREDNVLRLAARLVRRHGLDGFPALSRSQWLAERGVGPARAATLIAALELGRRAAGRDARERPQILTPEDASRHLRRLALARREHLVGLYLDGQNRLLARETLSMGSLNTTRTHPREILEPALRLLALGFILAHNHPGGSLEPSAEDLEFTRSVCRAATLMDIPFYDHLIVTRAGHVSLKERGLMPEGASW